jgi:hypothetical protein
VKNKTTDALSRVVIVENGVDAMAVIEILPAWLEDLKLSYINDDWAISVLQGTSQGFFFQIKR